MIIGESSDPIPTRMNCGENIYEGSSIVLSFNTSSARAKREAVRKALSVYRQHSQAIRALRCPKSCRRRVVVNIRTTRKRLWLFPLVIFGVRLGYLYGFQMKWKYKIECRER